MEWRQRGVMLYLLSCVFGIAISFTGWRCRALVSATCYTVLGVANKMLTVLANIIVWDDHASPAAKAVQEWPRPQPAPRRLCNPRHAPARPPYAPPAAPGTPRESGSGRATAGPRTPSTLTPTRSTLQAGLACLVGCLCCATAYRPAPLRRAEHEHDQASTPDTNHLRTAFAPPPPSRHLPCSASHSVTHLAFTHPSPPNPRLRGTFRRRSLRRPPPHPRVLPSLGRRCVPVSAPPHTHFTSRTPHPTPIPGARQPRH